MSPMRALPCKSRRSGEHGWDSAIVLGVDSFSILFSHRSFQERNAISPGFFGGFLERSGSLGLEWGGVPWKNRIPDTALGKWKPRHKTLEL